MDDEKSLVVYNKGCSGCVWCGSTWFYHNNYFYNCDRRYKISSENVNNNIWRAHDTNHLQALVRYLEQFHTLACIETPKSWRASWRSTRPPNSPPPGWLESPTFCLDARFIDKELPFHV